MKQWTILLVTVNIARVESRSETMKSMMESNEFDIYSCKKVNERIRRLGNYKVRAIVSDNKRGTKYEARRW